MFEDGIIDYWVFSFLACQGFVYKLSKTGESTSVPKFIFWEIAMIFLCGVVFPLSIGNKLIENGNS